MTPPRPFRSLGVPGLLILSLTGAHLGCDLDAKARQRQAEEAARRQREETEPPSPAVLAQLRQSAQDFLTEHNPEITVQGFSFTELTPNLFLIGANVTDVAHGNGYVKQLSAERLRDAELDSDGDVQESGDFLWVIDYLDEQKMAVLAHRHGIGEEVDSVRRAGGYRGGSWASRSWLDDYLLWHCVFHRPSTMGYSYGAPGYSSYPPGYRYYAPSASFQDSDIRPFEAAAAPTNGRSMVFLNGAAWNPPRSTEVPAMTGQAYGVSGHGGYVMGKTGMGGIARGGFGATGHAVHVGS